MWLVARRSVLLEMIRGVWQAGASYLKRSVAFNKQNKAACSRARINISQKISHQSRLAIFCGQEVHVV
ncbi:hypothetical protein ACUYFE_00150 [Olegusella massiliensis]|uniref:hypothetical protein n=1 Tax=Olegusella massiliensis TaxID=1776381 RepID=UPI0040558C92